MSQPAIDHNRLHQLSEEFTQVWERLQALYLDAAAGFAFVRQHVEDYQERARTFVRGTELDSIDFQDKRQFSYDQIFPGGFVTSGIHQSTLGEAKARNASGGENFVMLGQLCVVSFYDFWNEYLRREYVIAKGFLDRTETNHDVVRERLREHASHDLWGDLYYLRVSIVHHLGIATSDVAKCKLFRWFEPGQQVALTPEHMREIFVALLQYRNELFQEQFPEQVIVIY